MTGHRAPAPCDAHHLRRLCTALREGVQAVGQVGLVPDLLVGTEGHTWGARSNCDGGGHMIL